jgi:Ca2+-dependent lipid-binding protein
MDGDPIRTEVVKDTVNPIWYEPKEITIFFNDIEYAPPIILDVFDKDFGVLDKDDLLGRAIIHVNNICNFME